MYEETTPSRRKRSTGGEQQGCKADPALLTCTMTLPNDATPGSQFTVRLYAISNGVKSAATAVTDAVHTSTYCHATCWQNSPRE